LLGSAKLTVAGCEKTNPSGVKAKTRVSAPFGGESVTAEIVIVVGASRAPRGIESDGPWLRLRAPPSGPINALMLSEPSVSATQSPALQIPR
jgi:hypothetical protein